MTEQPNLITIEELRNYCDCPKKFQFLDFMGVSFGSYFIIDGFRRLNKKPRDGWSRATVLIGMTMLYIHAKRFFWAKQIQKPEGTQNV